MILSIDPSLNSSGYCFLSEDKKLLEYGTIKPKVEQKKGKKTPSERREINSQKIKIIVKSLAKIIDEHKGEISDIVIEDVPVNVATSPQTGKYLCVIQGCILGLATQNDISVYSCLPAEWRKGLKHYKTQYTCECGHSWVGYSKEKQVCPLCENSIQRRIEKKNLHDRKHFKQTSIDFANEKFDLDLYYKGSSLKNEDDISDAISIGYYFLTKCKGVLNDGKKN